MFNKSNIPAGEERLITIAVVTKGGANTGLAGAVDGALIDKLEDVLEEITSYIVKKGANK